MSTSTAGRKAPGAGAPALDRLQTPIVPGRGTRLPAAPRERRPALIALAIVLVVGGAAAAGLLALRLDERSPVLVARRDIVAGQPITEADLSVARVSAGDVTLIDESQLGQVVGRFARGPVPAGRLLDPTMLTDQGLFSEGDAAVGVQLDVGRVPATGLVPGDVVQVVEVRGGEATLLTDTAVVSNVREPAAAGGIGSGPSGSFVATLITTPELAPGIAAAAADNALALVLLQRNR